MAQRDSNETRKVIFSCAIQMFKEQGYANVTINDICEAAEVSKNTFYYYFSSKDALLLDLYHSMNQMGMDKIASILSAGSYVEQMWKIDESFLDFCGQVGADITRQIFFTNAVDPDHIFPSMDMCNQIFQAEAELVRKAQAAGQISNQSDPNLLVLAKDHIISGAVMAWCAKEGGFDIKEDVRKCFEALLQIQEDSSLLC